MQEDDDLDSMAFFQQLLGEVEHGLDEVQRHVEATSVLRERTKRNLMVSYALMVLWLTLFLTEVFD